MDVLGYIANTLDFIEAKIIRIEALCEEWEHNTALAQRRGDPQRIKDAYQEIRETVRSNYQSSSAGTLSDDPMALLYSAARDMWVTTRLAEFKTSMVSLSNLREFRDLIQDLRFQVRHWKREMESSRAALGDQPSAVPLTEPCVRASYTARGKP